MHACGHDMHRSVALGTALALHRLRDNFVGRIRVFFQPADEAEPLGARTVQDERSTGVPSHKFAIVDSH
ncbi:M20/M25/M40 family metallo-hydrolase [Bradyrhizobium hereditatis]|uniref:M20/M25/M40 family metallo-hydrolase n=1 Tax=Bradyrhizobium hereditatis TaxID=2821405 RepID=UPI00201C0281|nr:M20/M25/M40 family metallo-hydrolase [Bradyrhizobium hereditatis]